VEAAGVEPFRVNFNKRSDDAHCWSKGLIPLVFTPRELCSRLLLRARGSTMVGETVGRRRSEVGRRTCGWLPIPVSTALSASLGARSFVERPRLLSRTVPQRRQFLEPNNRSVTIQQVSSDHLSHRILSVHGRKFQSPTLSVSSHQQNACPIPSPATWYGPCATRVVRQQHATLG
jgi:hypothetical protein